MRILEHFLSIEGPYNKLLFLKHLQILMILWMHY